MTGTINNTYKLASGNPTLGISNVSGSAYVSATGTPTRRGVWRVRIQSGVDSPLVANIHEMESASGSVVVPVFSNRSYTTIVPGLTITLGTIAAGDFFDVKYTRYIADTI